MYTPNTFCKQPWKKEGAQPSHHHLDRSAKGPRRTGRPRTLLDEPVAPGQLTTESANEKRKKGEKTRGREKDIEREREGGVGNNKSGSASAFVAPSFYEIPPPSTGIIIEMNRWRARRQASENDEQGDGQVDGGEEMVMVKRAGGRWKRGRDEKGARLWSCARVYLELQVVTSRFMGKINVHFGKLNGKADERPSSVETVWAGKFKYALSNGCPRFWLGNFGGRIFGSSLTILLRPFCSSAIFLRRDFSVCSANRISKGNCEFPIEIFISIRILEYDNALRSIRISRKTCIDKIKIKVELSHFHEKKWNHGENGIKQRRDEGNRNSKDKQ